MTTVRQKENTPFLGCACLFLFYSTTVVVVVVAEMDSGVDSTVVVDVCVVTVDVDSSKTTGATGLL